MSDLGKYYKLPYEKDMLLSFDDFYIRYLDCEPKLLSLSVADDELLRYNFFLKYGKMITKINQCTPVEPAKLKHWFINNFFEGLSSYGQGPNDFCVDYSHDHLLDMREMILSLYKKSKGSDFRVFMKKLFADIFSDKTGRDDFFYPSYIDDISDYLSPDSILFLFELYRRFILDDKLSDLNKFNEALHNNNDYKLEQVLRKPILLVKPWPHQVEALKRWYDKKSGIIEMATATGKTVVGLNAIEKLYNDSDWINPANKGQKKLHVLILSHSLAILDQWKREAIEKLGLYDGIYDNGRTIKFGNGSLLIEFNTLQTVSRMPQNYSGDLLIVDEVHHGAAYEYRKALTVPYRFKMGLSATIEGNDRKYILDRYLGKVVYTLGIKEARELDIIPEFKWNICITYLDIKEAEDFKKITDEINQLFNKAVSEARDLSRRIYGVEVEFETIKDFIDFFERLRFDGKEVPPYWKLLSILIQERRRIIYKSAPKMERAISIAEAEAKEKKCLLFAMDIQTCNTISERLKSAGIDTYVMHSGFSNDENKYTLKSFKQAKTGILISAKMLDEGVDIPDAEVGINVASSRTRLQLVQRMGRILRKSPNKKTPVFYHLIALPSMERFVEKEDSLDYIDEVSWVQGLAIQWGINAEIFDDEDIKDLRKASENFAHRLLSNGVKTPNKNFGTIKVNTILSRMDDRLKKELVTILQKEHGQISDSRWREILETAYNEIKEPMDEKVLYGVYWLLLASGRNPNLILQWLN